MKTFTYQQVRDASVDYFNGDELAAEVFASKYALQDLDENIYELTPADTHARLARELARIEMKYPNPMSEEYILGLLTSWCVVPQGGPLSAIGNPFQVQSISNCFVIDSPYDSYGGIMKADQEEVQIMKRRGGVGFDLSPIRPKDMKAANAARTTDGIAIFMDRYSNTCREVAQGGRRGALMLSLSVHHPEVLTFANIKRDTKRVTGANISIRMTDEFMRALKAGEKYLQRFPVDAPPGKRLVERWVDAQEVWDNITLAMRDCSEPGMLFWDTTVRMGPADIYASLGFKTVSTNPCGELPLSAYDSCRLLLVNLWKFITDPFTPGARFDLESFKAAVISAQRLMDDIVDLELEAVGAILTKIAEDPEPDDVKRVERELWEKIKLHAEMGRRTGLGITGLGDAIAGLGMKYGSRDSVFFTESTYKNFALSSYRSSVTMAKERGAFPVYDREMERGHPFLERVMCEDANLREMYELYGRRNIANTTTPPAGSTSILAKVTSGCEPVLFVKSRRKRKLASADKMARVDEIDALGDKWQHYDLVHPGAAEWMRVTGETDLSKSPYHGSTVEEIDPLSKVDVQSVAQRWICHSISNTTNLPKDVTAETVSQICLRAWETGCKGVTVYRKDSRAAVIVDESAAREGEHPLTIVSTNAPKRPKELQCDIHRVTVKGESYMVLVGLLGGLPYEVFAGLSEPVQVPKKIKGGTLVKNGKKDGVVTYNLRIDAEDEPSIQVNDVVTTFDNAVYGAFTRTISLALRHGTPVQYLVEQLRKDKHSDITSFSSVIARVLAKGYIPDGTKVTTQKTCINPDCANPDIVYQGGCAECLSCGHSKCG